MPDANIELLISSIDNFLEISKKSITTPVEVSPYLEHKGILKDSRQRPGKPLRDILRAGRIRHAYQEGVFWKIPHSGKKSVANTVEKSPDKTRRGPLKIKTRESRITSLDPVSGDTCELLILGTMPGAASLSKGEYYADPRNRFWKIIGKMTGGFIPFSYSDKKRILIKNKIAIWDVARHAKRTGSLDQNMSVEEPNDIPGFVQSHKKLKVIAFNGTKAEKLHDIFFERNPSIEYKLLPSTSSANTNFSTDGIIEEWQRRLFL